MVVEHGEAQTFPISKCALGLTDAPWEFAEQNAEAIDAYWAKSQIERPKLFNGTIYLMSDWDLGDATLKGTFLRTDFKSFLYWRETGYGEAGVKDAFGSSLIRSSDGAILLGRQGEGHLNSGLAYPPSGMIDTDDARADGIDIDGSIARELSEESGLDPAEFERVPGYLVTMAGPLVSIAVEWRSALTAEALRERILERMSAQASPELADIVIVRRRAQIEEISAPLYARALLSRTLSA